MKILKDAGRYRILQTKAELKRMFVHLENAGRICYQSERGRINETSAKKFIAMIMRRGHESVIEHTLLTVIFNNISRGFTHEEVRHRLASFSQESTRYVDYAKKGADGPNLSRFSMHCVTPPHRDEHQPHLLEDGRRLTAAEMFAEVEKFYRALRKGGWASEDARQMLPIGVKSQIEVTANWREWRHIFRMRTGKRAHWEIRAVMVRLLREVKELIPVIFDDFIEADEKDKNGVPYFSIKDTV